MIRLDRAGNVLGALRCEIGFVRVLGSFKVSKRAASAVGLDDCPPFPAIAVRSQKARRRAALPAPLVLQVHGVRHFAQICDAVITDDTVDMVNARSRHNAIEVQPREAMQEVTLAVNLDPAVSMPILGSDRRVDGDAVAGFNLASKHASLRVVIENLLQPILRQFHLPSLLGAVSYSSMPGEH